MQTFWGSWSRLWSLSVPGGLEQIHIDVLGILEQTMVTFSSWRPGVETDRRSGDPGVVPGGLEQIHIDVLGILEQTLVTKSSWRPEANTDKRSGDLGADSGQKSSWRPGENTDGCSWDPGADTLSFWRAWSK